MKVMGIDPSLNCLGFFIYETKTMEIIDYGYVSNKNLDENEKILKIYNILSKVLEKYNIDAAGIEQEFYSRNVKTLRQLSHVHGAVVLLLSQHKIPYTYYSVMTLKSKVLNGMKNKKANGKKKTGKELKQEVANKIFEIFGKHNFIKDFTDDVTDAASAGIVYWLMNSMDTDTFNSSKSKNQKILDKNYLKINEIVGKKVYEIE
ncbi:MAG: crossover junction endodeoxyribonuclease RuvC [archaeon]